MAHYYIDPYSGKKKRNAHHRNKQAKRRLKSIYDTGGDSRYPWPVIWSEYNYDVIKHYNVKASNAYLKRNYRGKKSRYLKTISHRATRRKMKNEKISNTTYNKYFEFWWQLD